MSFTASETKSIFFGIGRRKTSVAKVILVPGTGLMVVNQKPGELYLQFNSQYINTSKAPLTVLDLENSYDIYVKTSTGETFQQQVGAADTRASFSRVPMIRAMRRSAQNQQSSLKHCEKAGRQLSRKKMWMQS